MYLGRQGGGGACIARTNQALIVGVYNKTMHVEGKKEHEMPLKDVGKCN